MQNYRFLQGHSYSSQVLKACFGEAFDPNYPKTFWYVISRHIEKILNAQQMIILGYHTDLVQQKCNGFVIVFGNNK